MDEYGEWVGITITTGCAAICGTYQVTDNNAQPPLQSRVWPDVIDGEWHKQTEQNISLHRKGTGWQNTTTTL